MPSWNWDESVDEVGVVHESVAGTDYDDGAQLQQGLQVSQPFFGGDTDLLAPLQEDSGTTVNDFSGNNRDGVYNGPALNDKALLGTDVAGLDGIDDTIDWSSYTTPANAGDASFAVTGWFWIDSNAAGRGVSNTLFRWGSGGFQLYQSSVDDNLKFNSSTINGQDVGAVGEGLHYATLNMSNSGTTDSYDVEVLWDGSTLGSFSGLSLNLDRTHLKVGGNFADGYLDGGAAHIEVVTRPVTSAEHTEIYNTVRGTGDWLGEGKLL